MCGRYVRRSDKQKLGDTFRVGNLTDIPLEAGPDYNVAPTTRQPVIRNNRDTGEREMVAMRWGMVPHFAKSLADFRGFSTINAQAETIMSKAVWRVPFQRRRCLVSADGFYEWKKIDPKTKQPYLHSRWRVGNLSLLRGCGMGGKNRLQRNGCRVTQLSRPRLPRLEKGSASMFSDAKDPSRCGEA